LRKQQQNRPEPTNIDSKANYEHSAQTTLNLTVLYTLKPIINF